MEIKDYIESGALEAYVLGSASEKEINELLRLKDRHPQIKDALTELEENLQVLAERDGKIPPPEMWDRIDTEINEITRRQNFTGLKITKAPSINGSGKKENTGEFVEVQGPSSHMRVHKLWRWVLGAIFVLGKIFLGFAIYYYLETRQVKEEIQELKQELKNIQKK